MEPRPERCAAEVPGGAGARGGKLARDYRLGGIRGPRLHDFPGLTLPGSLLPLRPDPRKSAALGRQRLRSPQIPAVGLEKRPR